MPTSDILFARLEVLTWRLLQGEDNDPARLLSTSPKMAAICVCAMTRSQIFLDGEGRTLGADSAPQTVVLALEVRVLLAAG